MCFFTRLPSFFPYFIVDWRQGQRRPNDVEKILLTEKQTISDQGCLSHGLDLHEVDIDGKFWVVMQFQYLDPETPLKQS
jgi:hypothetical protein